MVAAMSQGIDTGEFDAVVVGSGPAGVSACWPMLAAGMRVLMIDGGVPAPLQAPSADTLTDLRTDEKAAVRSLLDPDAYQTDVTATSPKLRTPVMRRWLSDYEQAYRVRTSGFELFGVLAPGGLSTAWGGGAGCFTADEMRGFPISRPDLIPSYQAVASRIGLSGSVDDDLGSWFGDEIAVQEPLALHAGARALYDRYRARGDSVRNRGLRLGRLRQAVLSRDHAGRKACGLSNLCLWGCDRGAIYSAAQELPALGGEEGFTLWPGAFVPSVRRAGKSGFILDVRDRASGETRRIAAPRVVLAAGTIGSTVLALGALELDKADVPLLTSPVMAFALFQPERLGKTPAREGYGMTQLAFALDIPMLPAGESLYGSIFASDGIPTSELIARMPLSRPAAVALARRIWPATLLGACFFPGEFTDNRLMLTAGQNGADVAITGGFTEDFNAAVTQARRRMARAAAGIGAFVIPGSASIAPPGADMHYCGTMPMSAAPQPTQTDTLGRPGGLPDLHVVDGSVLSRLPGKGHTFTIMANADRIGREIASHWRHDRQPH
jgi:choline dehydrogenase-like flavoprotein